MGNIGDAEGNRMGAFISRSWRRVFGAAALAVGSCAGAPLAFAAASSCESLGNGTHIGNATVILAQSVAAGDYRGQDGTKFTGLPAFCRIFAVATPHPSSHVLIEVWMPSADKWNGKLLGTGNGGAAGSIPQASLAGGLRRGYATVTTDLGSYPAAQPGIGFSFGDGRPEAVRDWAFRATHEMTVLAKDVVLRHYGKSAAKAYFVGCSTGGHQALAEAQKYPNDYDGIIAGAPANNRTHLHTRFAALRQLGMQPGAGISLSLMIAWQKAIMQACAGKDGGAPDDKFLSNPLACTILPRQLACKAGAQADRCLSETQVAALDKVYSGTRNPRTGQMIYFGEVRGSEMQLLGVYGDTPLSRNFNMTHWILPPERSTESFDFDRDMAAMDDALAVEVNAMNPDLSRFAAHGGKLIMFHGWADGLIVATDSLDYFQRIQGKGRNPGSFARLFMAPGMGHCAGGGLGFFGQGPEVPIAPDASPDNDLLMALDRWSETSRAPEVIFGRQAPMPTAVKPGEETKGIGQRPICAFPNMAKYDGKGDPNAAASFKCVKAPPAKYERPADIYLR